MPVLTMPNIQQLSNYHTYQAICSEIMVLTNTIDNERSQLANVRTHVNMSLSYLANLLNLASSPWYLVWMQCTVEPTLHPSGLAWIDLQTPVTVNNGQLQPITIPTFGYIPARQLNDIKRAGLSSQVVGVPGATQFKGNIIKLDLAQLLQLNSQENIQWRHSLAWTYTGQEILIYAGPQIQLDTVSIPAAPDYVIDTAGTDKLVFWGTRNPLLDDMLPVNTSVTYTAPVDLPDKYVWLLVKMGQKATLEQLSQAVPQALEQEINTGLAQLGQNLQTDIQLETMDREKRKYGQQQRPPGSV